MRLAGKKIVIGVCGSIAAYKSVLLLRLLQQEGATVRVAMTPAATRFVTPLTFSTLAQTPAFVDLWSDQGEWSQHVQWGHWADLLVIAPATANTLAKLAHGHCDDAVGAVYLSAACPVMVAPAMDREMSAHPTTRANFAQLESHGVHLVTSESGYLASGLEGQGRLAEPERLLERIVELLGSDSPPPAQGPLTGKRVLISAGPTQEAIDPVRYLSNHSTGKMGLALTQAALDAGAEVTLVLGPTHLSPPTHHRLVVKRTTTALDMQRAIAERQAEQHLIVMTAAVADFRPKVEASQKLKKKTGRGPGMTLELVENPDILAGLGQNKRSSQLLVGFALETENGLENARHKLKKKNADAIVLNTVGPDTAFGAETNAVTLLLRSGDVISIPLASKHEIARELIERLAPLIPA